MPALTPFIAQYSGELLALVMAFFWAASAGAFAQVQKNISTLEMNLIKSAGGALLIGMTMALLGQPLANINGYALLLFAASGAIGAGIGDIAYLAGLRAIGARRMLLLYTLTPPITALIALILLGEHLSWTAWLGIILTAAGVGWVITERRGNTNGLERMDWRRGVIFGLLWSLTQAAATVLSRAGFALAPVGAIQASLIRLGAALAALAIIIAINRQRPGRWLKEKGAGRNARLLLLGTLLGPFIAGLLLQAALKLAPAGIVQTLTSTNSLFAVALAAAAGERISLRSLAGALLAVAGIALLFGALG